MIGDKWLENLKVGDEVFVSRHWSGYEKGKIKRITKAQFVIDLGTYEQKFWRRNGYAVGCGIWDISELCEITPKRLEEVEANRLVRIATDLRGKLGIPSDIPTLKALIAALTPFVKKEVEKK